MIKVTADFELTDEVRNEYIEMVKVRHGGDFSQVSEIKLHEIDKENIEATLVITQPGFDRIRRITGYLSGTTDRWNNAKQAEEKDRVKHA